MPTLQQVTSSFWTPWILPLTLIILALGFAFGLGAAYLAISVCVAVYIYVNPIEALWGAFAVLALGELLLPLGPDTDFGADSPVSFWYWGVALGLVTTAAFLALRRKHYPPADWKALPRPLFWSSAFLLLCVLLSIIYGSVAGDGLSASLRQGTGTMLFLAFIYFTLRIAPTSVEFQRFASRTQLIMLAYSFIYALHYLPRNLGTLTFVRERSPLLFFAGLFGAVALVTAYVRPKWRNRWEVLFSCVIFASAILVSGFRSPLLAMLISSFVLILAKVLRRPLRLLLATALVFLVIAANPVRQIENIFRSIGLHPELAQRFTVNPLTDSSVLDRMSELYSIWQEVQVHPVLGKGMGSSFEWFEPEQGITVTTSFVDSGIGFLLLKMGLMGFIVFTWWAAVSLAFATRLWRAKPTPESLLCLCALAYYLLFLFLGPSFFQFVFSPWAGVVIGYVYVSSSRSLAPQNG
jgi:O-antigen ligase